MRLSSRTWPGTGSKQDFARCIAIARGSAAEVDYLVLLAKELGYLNADHCRRFRRELDEIQRMCTALWSSLTSKPVT